MKCTTGRGGVRSVAMAAALTVLTACTSSEPSPKPENDRAATSEFLPALRLAERSTDRAESARVRSTTVMGTQLSVESEGALDWGSALTGTLTITYTGGTTADTMRGLGITSMEARYLSDAYYARMGDAFAEKAGGKHWLRYVYDDLEALGGGGANFADQMRNTTPNQSVKLLLDCEDVRKVGAETVNGQPTTHYSGTVEVSDVADAELRQQLEGAGVTTQTVDIWVDDQDLLVKKVEKGRMATGELTQTAYYSDYGVRVSVQKPPAGDTEDFKELLKQQGALGNTP
ncbi:LppX_LprAFG lipoprotein [Streptomyces sp. NBC_01373]|uniref:LppX_LprAFG lipoprotein n=1 Tax=Streptomyces sp. NBC_01373 TaxID=2903843 RepID=UPI0022514CDC|nr:LppX_LprAFG lipoprotein [Streptomyces sp. NBC_01373]MCX4698640.1 LppX_LprAFG lipoprotein [Streptomyces sp. NBC_01373]